MAANNEATRYGRCECQHPELRLERLLWAVYRKQDSSDHAKESSGNEQSQTRFHEPSVAR